MQQPQPLNLDDAFFEESVYDKPLLVNAARSEGHRGYIPRTQVMEKRAGTKRRSVPTSI